jgi:integration host factor subunit alpha
VTKADIVEIVQRKIDLPRKEVAEIVDSTFELIREQLAKGDDVKLPGFGNFLIREKNQRIGRNPKTGKEIMITARKVVTFKPSTILRDRVS